MIMSSNIKTQKLDLKQNELKTNWTFWFSIQIGVFHSKKSCKVKYFTNTDKNCLKFKFVFFISTVIKFGKVFKKMNSQIWIKLLNINILILKFDFPTLFLSEMKRSLKKMECMLKDGQTWNMRKRSFRFKLLIRMKWIHF